MRPILVRSHISKIMEKAILTKINKCCPHLISSKIYQAGFKEGKSTAIHASRLLNEVHGNKKRKFNLLIDLLKPYDSVDREILWELFDLRCKDEGERIIVKLLINSAESRQSKLESTPSMLRWDYHKGQFYRQCCSTST